RATRSGPAPPPPESVTPLGSPSLPVLSVLTAGLNGQHPSRGAVFPYWPRGRAGPERGVGVVRGGSPERSGLFGQCVEHLGEDRVRPCVEKNKTDMLHGGRSVADRGQGDPRPVVQ